MKNRRDGFSADEGAVIEIESSCIEEFAEQVATFFLCVFNRLGWEIDDSWQTEL